ncbi:MAG: hypothetical protein FWC16_15165 [Defluviitaleaceae bacterium]|nr:hypothetical protein [Defluviitaleaceae bacterium]MCL2276254.1 hypothetical protein [Defluviitaleaceae bacterium]
MDRRISPRAGFTLLEAVIALGIWFILSTGVIFAWRYAANASGGLIMRQNAFENARAAMDAIIMNVQLSNEIELITDDNHVLRYLRMPGIDPSGMPRNYTFSFNPALPAGHVRHNRLEFSGNEFASHIARVYIVYVMQRRLEITIITDCAVPIRLEGSVCVRYKAVK